MNEYDSIDLYNENDCEVDLTKQRIIRTKSADAEIQGLHKKYLKGKLVIQPAYQRLYVWDAKKASRLVESALLGIPIPIIYLAETDNGQDNVIDGQQRLTSLFSFIDGTLPDGRPFKLTGLNVLTELKGKTFKDLDETIQDQILEYTIRTITFTADSDPDLQYEIFTRLNTGSVALNDQELRNCIFRGKFNDLIKELAEDSTFRTLLGLSKEHPRMKDVELVLRFIAFYTNTYINYTPPVKKFLNDTMRTYRDINSIDEKQIRNVFKKAVTNTHTLLGKNAFRRFKAGEQGVNNGGWNEQQFNVALYDITMDSMARIDTPVLIKNRDAIYEAFVALMSEDENFIKSLYYATSDSNAINTRFQTWNAAIASIVNDPHADVRCFSRALKKSLYSQDSTCAICGQHIVDIDDAAVDHIEQYWMGGKTIPSNARLTHRCCNCARSKHDTIK